MTLIAAWSLVLIAVPLDYQYYQDGILGKPPELFPLLPAAVLGYFLFMDIERRGITEINKWVAVVLVVFVVEQLTMVLSAELFDFAFQLAHVLQILSVLLIVKLGASLIREDEWMRSRS